VLHLLRLAVSAIVREKKNLLTSAISQAKTNKRRKDLPMMLNDGKKGVLGGAQLANHVSSHSVANCRMRLGVVQSSLTARVYHLVKERAEEESTVPFCGHWKRFDKDSAVGDFGS
jgi:hypothetical protein